MKVLVIGAGDVGLALYQIIVEHHKTGLLDLNFNKDLGVQADTIHICYPYKDDFVDNTLKYIEVYNPKNVIIESTVAVGTCREIHVRGENCKVFHSPIRGPHNKLYTSLKTFVKFVSGIQSKENSVYRIVDYYKLIGIPAEYVDGNWETTEVGKLLSTMQYGVGLALADELQRICEKFDVDYATTVRWFNRTYNEGFTALGQIDVVRPTYDPPNGKIGGHCVVQNAELLRKTNKSEWLDMIIEYKK